MIEQVLSKAASAGLPEAKAKTITNGLEAGDRFGNLLGDAMDRLRSAELNVHRLNEQFIKGDMNDPARLLIAAQKSSLGLELTVEVRDKAIQAYQEIMRMQI